MRRQSRELSLQILFQIEFSPQMSLGDLTTLFEKNFEPSVLSYALELVTGVQANKEKIDLKISSASSHWKIDRMASVDRNLLRSAVYEMFFAKAIKNHIGAVSPISPERLPVLHNFVAKEFLAHIEDLSATQQNSSYFAYNLENTLPTKTSGISKKKI